MQSGVLVGAAPYALPLKHKILPQFLNDLGYKSVAVGKWHLGTTATFQNLTFEPQSYYNQKLTKISLLGSHSANYTPTNRGFASHVGYWTGQ